ncbi:MAG: DUF1670 domain-containing protein [Ignavibacteria bacterium]|nr:DUF1670 domain-containing protein [Ignavibacteria bacterium]
MKTAQARQQHKTSEGEFLYELKTYYELSPKMSESILESAKNCLIRDNVLKEGEIETSVISLEERSGKMIENMRKIRVRLTIDNGIEDTEIQRTSGRVWLRRLRIQRISNEALEQDGILSQEDLSKYLVCSVRTIKRDIAFIKKLGIEVITRGVLHNIGRGQTHKVMILGQYLEGKTFSEIRLRTKHSTAAIKRYVQDFQKVLMSIHHGIKQSYQISNSTGLSKVLVNQYITLINQSKSNPLRKAIMKDMVRQWNRSATRIKKKEVTSKDYMRSLAPMTGGKK